MANIDKSFGHNLDYLKADPKLIEVIKHEDAYIYNLKKNQKNKLARRKVYEKVEYTEFEKKGIQDLKDLFKSENENNKKHPPIVLPDDWRESDWLKMCYTQRFETKKCLEKLREHVEWRKDPKFHNVDKESLELIQKGFVYQLGRDKGQRPVIILDATKIDIKDGKDNIVRALSIFLSAVKKYMFYDYAVENWVLILDLHGMGLGSVPLKALGAIIGSMSTNFCATLEKMFIVNPSSGLGWMWGGVTAFMDDETSDKIRMIKSKEIDQILEQIPNKKYLQQQHGGDLPNMTNNFWPPKDLYTDFEAIAKKKQQEEEEKQKKLKEEEEEKQKKIKEEEEQKLLLIKKEEEEKQKENEEKQQNLNDAEIQKQQDQQKQNSENNNNEQTQKPQLSPLKIEKNEQTIQAQEESQKSPGIMITHVEDKLVPIHENQQNDQKKDNNTDQQFVSAQSKQQKRKVRSACPDDEDDEEEVVVQVQQKQQQIEVQGAQQEVQQLEIIEVENQQNPEEPSPMTELEGGRQGGCECQCSIF